MKVNKNKNTQVNLTYEEHKRIDEFLRHWHKEGKEIFELIRKAFGEKGYPTINMAKAAKLMSGIHQYCETKSCFDRPPLMQYDSDEFSKWHNLYYHIGMWTTSGWEKARASDK